MDTCLFIDSHFLFCHVFLFFFLLLFFVVVVVVVVVSKGIFDVYYIGNLLVWENASNVFCSENTGPIKAKFHLGRQWVGGTKVCSPHLNHVSNMAATPIYEGCSK